MIYSDIYSDVFIMASEQLSYYLLKHLVMVKDLVILSLGFCSHTLNYVELLDCHCCKL